MKVLSTEQVAEFVKILDSLIASASWDESSFYRAMGNKLRIIRDNVNNLYNADSSQNKLSSHMVNRVALRKEQQEVFIGLYSSDGTNLFSWEQILSNLPGQIIARPIYAEEEQIKNIIKSKTNITNEAYVSIYVNQNSFVSLNADKMPIDKLGQKMLILKNNSINLEYINFFVHMFKRYQYLKGRLVA